MTVSMNLTCVLLALFCVGCGKEATTPHTVASTPAAQPQAAVAAAPAPVATAPATPATVLAKSDNDGGTARAEVTELKRIPGDMLMLRLAVVNTGTETIQMGFQFTDSHTSDINSISGVTLIDPINKKKYFVVRDGANNCVCSEGLKDIKAGERRLAWARFPAPPGDVQKISVLLPHFPPIDEVGIAQ